MFTCNSSIYRRTFGVIVLLLVPCIVSATGEETDVRIDLTKRAQTLEGWGTSLAWWAHSVGDWEEENLDRLIDAIIDPEEGLGLNVFRYNIGGGEHPDHDHMRPFGHIPGYQPEEDGPYVWDADAGQVRVLKKLAARTDGAILEAFSNSPPWWMTHSGCAAGSEDGSKNLKRENETAFATYLVDVVEHLYREEGISFRTLQPMNEPNANWWTSGNNQEGCHVPEYQQGRLIQRVGERLGEIGLPTVVSASDASSLGAGLSNLRSYDAETLSHLGQFNVHSYFGDEREELRDLAAERGLPLWQSETGPLNTGGNPVEITLIMADRVIKDLNELQPVIWNIWQVLDSHRAWRHFEVDYETEEISPHRNGHMLRQFTRFIRPGDEVVPVSESHVLAAVSEERKEAVLVLVNDDQESRRYKVEIAGVPDLVGAPQVFRTSAEEAMESVDGVEREEQTVSIELSAQSITTVVLGW